jgi:DNA-binding transcriptional LysR family regulator
MAISLKNIRYFLAVAEAESITGATQTLHISQSVVTEAIKTLESDLGVTLFQRHARGMILTHAGHQFLRHAHNILAAVKNAQAALSMRPDTMGGEIHIGVTSLVCGYFLPYLLDRYRRVFPGVEVRVVEDQREYLEHLLVNGELDVAVLLVSNVQDHQALECEALLQSPWRAWLPASHRLLDEGQIALASLADEPLIQLRSDALEQPTQHIRRATGVRPRRVIQTASVEAVRSLVATGAGLCVLPDMLFRPWSLEGDRLEMRPIVDPIPPVEVGLAWRRGSGISEAAQNFLVIAREHSRLRV